MGLDEKAVRKYIREREAEDARLEQLNLLHDVTDEVIKSLCLEALRRCEGNKRCAAPVVGISRDSLYRHMKRFGIEGGQSARGLRVKLAQGLIL
jgi:DNA-binding NtrC family response regulator